MLFFYHAFRSGLIDISKPTSPSAIAELNSLPPKKPAILVQIINDRIDKYDRSEMMGLADTAGYHIYSIIEQKINNLHPKWFLGSGKTRLIKEALDQYFHVGQDENKIENSPTDDIILGVDIPDLGNDGIDAVELKLPEGIRVRKEICVIFNNRLGNMQIINLGKEWGVKVIDRDEVVLEIFDINARTKESRLQIELARLALQSNLIRKEIGQHLDEKQGRDFMGKGMPGWAPVARAFTSRRKKILTELKDIAQARNLRRKQRSKFFNIGIVGYTNAGKTTLLNALAKESLETANQEFTTVTTTSRRVKLPTFDEYGRFIGEEVIFTDSVGFIYDISHFLIEAFLSTLEELQFSDLIAIVVDIADKQEERLFLKIDTSFSVMGQIGANTIPKVFIFNKSDSIDTSIRDSRIQAIHEKYPNIPYAVISAANRTGFDALTAMLIEQKKKIRIAKY